MTQSLSTGPVVAETAPAGRTVVNGAWLLGANIISSGAQYLIVVLVARTLGPESFGSYVFAFTFASFFATICNFGLDRVLIREVVRQPGAALASLLAAARLRLLLGIASVALALTTAWTLGYSPRLGLAIALLLLAQVLALFSELFRSVLFAAGRMAIEARLRALGRAVAVGLVASGLVLRWDLIGLAAALAAGALIELALYAGGVARPLMSAAIAFDRRTASKLVWSALPVALNTALVVLYLRINIVTLTAWAGAEQVGLFGAAFTFVQVLQVVSGSLAGVLLPTLTARKQEGSEPIRHAVGVATFYVLLFVLPTSVFIHFLAGDLIGLVYGAEYSAAVPPLAVLALANPFMFLGSLYGTLLIVLDAERALIPLSAAALAVSGLANFVLVPELGTVGAAWATVATELAVAAIAFWAARVRLGPLHGAGRLWQPFLVAGIVAAALAGVRDVSGPVRALVGIATFAAGAAAVTALAANGSAITMGSWTRRGAGGTAGR